MAVEKCRHALDQDFLRQALARYSLRGMALLRDLEKKRGKKTQTSGGLKRAAQQVLGPYRFCTHAVKLPAIDPQAADIEFYVADVRKVLDLVCARCPAAEEMLLAEPGGELHMVLAHDEATGGNVLNPLLRKKLLLFYVTFTSLKTLWLSHRAWFPAACITHDQLQGCKGGMSAATAAAVRFWSETMLQGPICIGSKRVSVRVHLAAFISDLDSLRGTFAAKGSAALKPCGLCMNCIARYAGSHCNDEGFRTVEEHDFRRFKQYDRHELESVMVAGIQNAARMNKADKELHERVLGYNFDADSIWACRVSRSLLHIDKIQNDALHSYWSNGICNSEVSLLLAKVKKEVGLTLPALQELCVAAEWQRHNKGESRRLLRRLFKECQFGDGGFKGSASDTIALCALVRWLAESHWLRIPALRAAAQCFLQLCRATDLLRGTQQDEKNGKTWQKNSRCIKKCLLKNTLDAAVLSTIAVCTSRVNTLSTAWLVIAGELNPPTNTTKAYLQTPCTNSFTVAMVALKCRSNSYRACCCVPLSC